MRKDSPFGTFNQIKPLLLTGFLSLIFLSLLISVPETTLSASEPSLEQEVLKPEELFIGSPFTLQVRINTGLNKEIHHPVKDTIGVFTVVAIDKDTVRQEERSITNIRYRLAPFDTGDLIFPPLVFEIFDTEKNEIKTIRSQAVELKVYSVLSESDPDLNLKDIKAPISLRFGFWDYVIPISLLLVVIAGLVLVWKKLKAKKDIPLPEKIIQTQPPSRIALQLLDELKKRRLLEKGEFLEYYFQLSYILRLFLELYYRFRAVEMTGTEIKEQIRNFSEQERSELSRFLNETDMVKFAKYVPPVKHALDLTEWLEKYLRSFSGIAGNISSANGESGNQNHRTSAERAGDK